MRDLVIAECIRLADSLREYLDPNWDKLSNRQLLKLYGDLLIDTECEDY